MILYSEQIASLGFNILCSVFPIYRTSLQYFSIQHFISSYVNILLCRGSTNITLTFKRSINSCNIYHLITVMFLAVSFHKMLKIKKITMNVCLNDGVHARREHGSRSPKLLFLRTVSTIFLLFDIIWYDYFYYMIFFIITIFYIQYIFNLQTIKFWKSMISVKLSKCFILHKFVWKKDR